MNAYVSIGQAQRDMSELVDHITCAGKRMILALQGKTKSEDCDFVSLRGWKVSLLLKYHPQKAGHVHRRLFYDKIST